jgi:hypothetical protein
MWMLHFVQHDKERGAFSMRNNRILALFCEVDVSLESWKTQANLSE